MQPKLNTYCIELHWSLHFDFYDFCYHIPTTSCSRVSNGTTALYALALFCSGDRCRFPYAWKKARQGLSPRLFCSYLSSERLSQETQGCCYAEHNNTKVTLRGSLEACIRNPKQQRWTKMLDGNRKIISSIKSLQHDTSKPIFLHSGTSGFSYWIR